MTATIDELTELGFVTLFVHAKDEKAYKAATKALALAIAEVATEPIDKSTLVVSVKDFERAKVFVQYDAGPVDEPENGSQDEEELLP